MPRGIPSSTKLSQILRHLNAEPTLHLPTTKSLKITYASHNDHFGARHFVKEQLPRIRYANPNLEIQVLKVKKSKEEQWRPQLDITFEEGTSHTFNLQDKWSTTIVRELMDVAGGNPWEKWKADAIKAQKPIVPGEENAKDQPGARVLPTLAESQSHIPEEEKQGIAAALP